MKSRLLLLLIASATLVAGEAPRIQLDDPSGELARIARGLLGEGGGNHLFYLPTRDYIKKQSETNKQGGGEPYDAQTSYFLQEGIGVSSEVSFEVYEKLLDQEIARETARIILPLNTYTTWVWKIDLHNLLHFLTLRADPHAQQEIRDYAEAIITLVAPLFPQTFEAWEDYQRQAKSFSRMDLALLQAVMRRFTSPQASLYAMVDEHRGVERLGAAYGMTKREIVAFFDKVGVVVPEGG
jgi:thymidylate synthase ThyX